MPCLGFFFATCYMCFLDKSSFPVGARIDIFSCARELDCSVAVYRWQAELTSNQGYMVLVNNTLHVSPKS